MTMTKFRMLISSKRIQASIFCSLAVFAACIYPHRPPQLDFAEQVQLNGQLRVATQMTTDNIPMSSSRAGFELALAQLFARHLGVGLQLVQTNNTVYRSLRADQADVGLVHYTTAPNTQSGFSFIEPYLKRHLLPMASLEPADDELSSVKLAWAYRGPNAEKFNALVENFFAQIRNDGTFDHLYQQYFDHMEMSVAESRSFRYNLNQRLPEYQTAFEKNAKKTQLDWRLLAAIGYQESHWDSDAVSPTGVRGLMMLTQITADEVGVDNRHNAKQSIAGGSTYFRKLKDRLDAEIPEPHRTWMALAAYNMGIGHLEDARTLTRRLKGDANNWFDVKRSIPLLQQYQYYSQVSNGYAMGARQSLLYVENVRRYFDILIGFHPEPVDVHHTSVVAMR